ncbi:RNA 2',3'-cyclic phosphodiesterase [Janibacter cremeus]|uniref:RNA 2',3'-cyclic phosphodiesterase n=1 Tax=Janibacter cremeus TaxID=1285192 RepID=A0A852VTT0_9MICO|nr:2'-5' RNA ligase [Janibacter cremeus]
MGQRMFVAVVPPQDVLDELADFLAPREGMPWIDPSQWHLTLAFLASVPDAREDEFVDHLGVAAARVTPFDVVLGGAGCFPEPSRAKVLWLGVDEVAGESLTRLATGARAAANVSGATPDGKAFVPHLSLARLKRSIEATKWLRVLDTFSSSRWRVREIELIASHLGEGPRRRPRYETVARLALSGE